VQSQRLVTEKYHSLLDPFLYALITMPSSMLASLANASVGSVIEMLQTGSGCFAPGQVLTICNVVPTTDFVTTASNFNAGVS
jgi:hypothetical protein